MSKVRAWLLRSIPLGILSGLMFMAQVGPAEARTNFAKWAASAGITGWPVWLSDSAVLAVATAAVLAGYLVWAVRGYRARSGLVLSWAMAAYLFGASWYWIIWRSAELSAGVLIALGFIALVAGPAQLAFLPWLGRRKRVAESLRVLEIGSVQSSASAYGFIAQGVPFAWVKPGTVTPTIEHDDRTPVSLVVEHNGAIWFALRLVNHGPKAEFRAELRITETNARFHPGNLQAPLWFEAARSVLVTVLAGGSEWIRIARSDLFCLFRYNPHLSESAVLLDQEDFEDPTEFGAPPRFAEFDVTILREPPFPDGPYVARFRYARSGWNYPTLSPIDP